MKIVVKVVVLLSVCFSSWVFSAEHFGTISRKTDTPFIDFGYDNLKIKAHITLDVNWKIWTLMGEPVVDSLARWKIHSVTTLKTTREHNNPVTREKIYLACSSSIRVNCYPASYFKNIDIIEAKIKLKESRNTPSFGMIIDPGVFGKPWVANSKGDESFNTPSSPHWNEFFVNYMINFNFKKPEYISVKKAKKIFLLEKVKMKDTYCANSPYHSPDCFFVSFNANFSSFISKVIEAERAKALEKEKQAIKAKKIVVNKKIHAKESDDIFADFEVSMQEEVFEQIQTNSLEDIKQQFAVKLATVAQINKDYQAKTLLRMNDIRGHSLPSDQLTRFSERVQGDYLYGFKNGKGVVVIKPQFIRAMNFHEGLAAVKSKKGWGYINHNGDWQISPRKDWWKISSFIDGKAWVRIDYVSLKSKRCGDNPYKYKEYNINPQGKRISEVKSKHDNWFEICLTAE